MSHHLRKGHLFNAVYKTFTYAVKLVTFAEMGKLVEVHSQTWEQVVENSSYAEVKRTGY